MSCRQAGTIESSARVGGCRPWPILLGAAAVKMRLVRAYRGYKRGEVVEVGAETAAFLQVKGYAVPDDSRPLLPHEQAERAVVTPDAEHRGGWDET